MSATPEITPNDLSSLTPDQLQAAHLLLAGHSYGEVCSALSIGRTTLYRWRQGTAFAAYLAIATHQIADETQFQILQFLQRSLQLLREQLFNPATDPKAQLRLAEKLLALYTRLSYLTHLKQEPDTATGQSQQQVRQMIRQAGYPDTTIMAPEHRALHQQLQAKQVLEAIVFDQRQAQPPSPAPCGTGASPVVAPAAPAQGQTTSLTPKPTLIQPAPQLKMKQNGASAKQTITGNAMDAALSSVRTQIASATRS